MSDLEAKLNSIRLDPINPQLKRIPQVHKHLLLMTIVTEQCNLSQMCNG